MSSRRLTLCTLVLCGLASAAWSGCRSGDPAVPVAVQGDDVVLPTETERIRGRIPPGSTLETLLRQYGLAAEAAHRSIAAVREVFDPRRLRAAQPFECERTLAGRFRNCSVEVDDDRRLTISLPASTDAPSVEFLPIPRQREEATIGGWIGGDTPSLFQAMHAAGERPELAVAMAEIFAGEIDFNTQLQPGDRFGLVFEKFVREAHPSTYGAIDAAEFQNEGRVVRAIRFAPPGGVASYYDEAGRSLHRFFLQSPLKFEPRITSGFSRQRFHPVLGVGRPHLGVDYGAPVGAAVVAVASGRVVSATYDNVNGRMVRLRHAGGYETYYLHLSAFGPGIRAGVHVDQAQLIGQVGATGLATGPHLDYRVRKDGVFVNPVLVLRTQPPGEPVPETARDAFEAQRDALLERLTGTMRADDGAPSGS